MKDSDRTTRATLTRTPIGYVGLGGDRLIVHVVERTYRGGNTENGREPVVTHTPAAVEVRREPPTETGDVGLVPARAARELAALLTRAARLADKITAGGTP